MKSLLEARKRTSEVVVPPPNLQQQAEVAAAALSELQTDLQAPSPGPGPVQTSNFVPQHGSHRPSDGHIHVHRKWRPWTKRRRSSLDSESHSGDETPIDDVPRPAYSDAYGKIEFSHNGFETKARIAVDGRIDININQRTRKLSNILATALQTQVDESAEAAVEPPPPAYLPPFLSGFPGAATTPPLNVVIHVVGSRGDVQPFVSLGQVLKKKYGHRVRLATHPIFKQFVEENGLEFFSIGGDPTELMAFMVKNPGLMPGYDSLRSGDVGKRRKAMYEIVTGCWRSCIEADDGTGPRVSNGGLDSGICVGDPAARSFVADAIIANPPSFAHIHCAEKLGIPLHLMFTMPWSPTQSFPHPLANIQSSNADSPMTNFVSYALVELLTWQGLGDIINRFRRTSLGLQPVGIIWAPGLTTRLRIPHTYCWSPALIPKPRDWGSYIDISGFFFLPLAANYTPADDLTAFLAAGPKPVYIGFGSIVVDNPNAMTKLIFDAVKKTGHRALVSKGWGGLGVDEGVPEEIFMLGNVPHDWLFKHVSCVVHHGGAGTTAAGIALGRPTVVIPFFGDQRFWGAMVARAGAGPTPIPYKELTAEKLAAAIMEALTPTTLQRAEELGAKISKEKGADVGAKSFHRQLHIERCVLAPSRAAVWRIKRTDIRLSPFAATVLAFEGLLNPKDLKLYRPREYDTEDRPWDPITGGASALLGTIGSLMMGIADFPTEIFKALRCLATDSAETRLKLALSLRRASTRKPVLDLRTESTNESASALRGQAAPTYTSSIPNIKEPVLEKQDTEHPVLSDSDSAGSLVSSTSHGGSTAQGLSKGSSQSYSSNDHRTLETPHGSHRANIFRPGMVRPLHLIAAGKDFLKMVNDVLIFPMSFMMSLAKGFHNAPILYGDETVRHFKKITDLQSGLSAAGKELGYGLYDGISGLVTQPYVGVKKEGFKGLLKGLGKGFGGLILKPTAAAIGLPVYTIRGVCREIRKTRKHFGFNVQNYVMAARTTQGYEDWQTSTPEERLDVVDRWYAMQAEIQKEKNRFLSRWVEDDSKRP